MALQMPDLREDSHAVTTGVPFVLSRLSFLFITGRPVTDDRGEWSVPDVGSVTQFMTPQVTRLVVSRWAESAGEGFFTGVCSDMPFHVTVGGEGITALPAHEGTVARVYQQVALQVVGFGEAGAADMAGMRLLPRVDQVVLLQVTGSHKCHLANITPVGTIT